MAMASNIDWSRVLDSEGRLALVVPAAGGVLFHVLVLARAPVEEFMYNMLGAGLVAVGAGFVGQVANGFSWQYAAIQTTVVTGTFLAGVFSSMLTYRAFFHRLHKFPGPFGAKLSRFWSCGRAAKNVQYYKEVEKMVDQYGDFVRTGPRELCVVRKEAIPLLYGPNSKCGKTTWYAQGNVDGDKISLHMNRDKAAHRRRRRAWDRSTSVKALNSYVPRILGKVDQFLEQMSESTDSIDATKWSMFLAFDIMGEVGFGQNFECLTTGIEHPAIKCIHDHMEVLGILSHIPWFLNIIPRIPGAAKAYTPFFKFCGDALDAKRKTINLGEDPQDVTSWLIKAFNEKDISASPTLESLHDDSRAVIVAGSDTTATTLAWIFYYFSKYPRVLAKLQAEVDAVMPNEKIEADDGWNSDKLKNIPYIDAIIYEALRLRPATLTGGYRETPPQGLTIDGTFIPGGTNVFVPFKQIQTDPRYWPESKEFIPERWTEKREEWGTDDAPYLPFSTGLNSCPGKNLAMLTMRIALSRFAQKCSVAFPPGEDGVEFDEGAKDTFTTTLLPLKLDFQPRQK